jgi:ABC-type transporter Mla MlaB component
MTDEDNTSIAEEKKELPQNLAITESNNTAIKDINTLITEWITISLPAILTIAQLSEWQTQLCQHRGQRVRLSGNEIKRIDTAALQLLLAFVNNSDVTVGWIDPSSELRNAAGLLGLTLQLRLPMTENTF